jgi:hypothetical protein
LLVAGLVLSRHCPRYSELPMVQLHAMKVHGNKSYRVTYFEVGTRCSIKLRKVRGTEYAPTHSICEKFTEIGLFREAKRKC